MDNMSKSKVFKLDQLGLEVEIGKFARQADGSVWLKSGNNIVLSTVVASRNEKEFMGFFPLTVEYREKTSAAGRIPGGYIKREGRLSDGEVLISRLIDRPIRPLFPKYYFNEVQLISSVYSYDGKFPTGILGIIASSLALTISRIPFLGPVGAVRIGRIDGKFVFNASVEDYAKSDVDIIISGTKDGISMVEGKCNSLSEKELSDVMFQAYEQIKIQIDWQNQIREEIGVGKDEIPGDLEWTDWENKIKDAFGKEENFEGLFCSSKEERSKADRELKEKIFNHFKEDLDAGNTSESKLSFLFENIKKEIIPNMMIQKNKRLDGRAHDQIRTLNSEVSLLPSVHGSSLFTRGETQALASLTLGTGQDAQKVETLEGESERTFMLHYNFPPFSTGEVKPIRGVGRREIGHGYLAERSFSYVIPSQEEFPYTVRMVVDVLESNGSSSMATVCSTTLALMDAGVPIKNMVSGIAMGLVQDSSGKFQILSDILGTEDGLGLMDFKVTGTDSGVMAIQMDIKLKSGLTKELLSEALEQARKGRLFILEHMKSVMDKPRGELSSLAPRVFSFKIDPEKIGLVIGPAGKNIKEIIAKTKTEIDITDDGTVKIYSQDSDGAKAAEKWIKTILGDIKVGDTFDGIIRKIADFGLFVELVPGKDGLVHISAISRDKQRLVGKEIKTGDTLKVKVIDVEEDTGRVRLVAPDLK